MDKKLVKRILALLYATALIITNFPDMVYASATSSNSSHAEFEDFEHIEENLSTPYAESFKYCPKTLESALNPDSRFAFTSSAVLYILTAILAACGIYISFEDDIVSIFTSFESWLRVNYGDNTSVMTTWNDVLVGATAATIVGMKTFIPIFKKYLNSSLDGYGTDTPDFSLASVDLFSPVLPELSALAESRGLNYFFTFKCWNTKNTRFDTADIYLSSGSGIACAYYVANGDYRYMYFLDNNQKPVSLNIAYVMSDSTGIEIRRDTDFTESASCFLYARTFGESLTHFPFKVFSSLISANDYISTGNINGLAWDGFGSVSITADKTWSDLQTKDDATNIDYGDSLIVPDTDEALQKILAALGIASSAQEVADALAPSITVTTKPSEDTDDEAQKLPWFPAISKWLTGIQAGIDNIGKKVTEFPQTVADIKAEVVELKEAVTSFPTKVKEFCAIDKVAISGGMTAVQVAFMSRFDALFKIPEMFMNLSVKLDSTIPIITMKIPETLHSIYGGDSVIVFDLREYKSTCEYIRLFFRALLWFGFGFAVLNEFDVKFHIG